MAKYRHWVAIYRDDAGTLKSGYTRSPPESTAVQAWIKISNDLADDHGCSFELVCLVEDAAHVHPLVVIRAEMQDQSDSAHL